MSQHQAVLPNLISSMSVTASPSPSGGGIEYTRVAATPASHGAIATQLPLSNQQSQNFSDKGFPTSNINSNLCTVKQSAPSNNVGDPTLIDAEWYWGDITREEVRNFHRIPK